VQVSTEVFSSRTNPRIEILALDRTRPSSRDGSLRQIPDRIAVLCLWLCASINVIAQVPSAPSSNTDSAKPIPTVVTTVEVKGRIEPDYSPETSTVSGYVDAPLKDTPQSILTVTRGVMDDQQARVLSDITKNDASIGEDYAPVGYYQDFQIRGFPVDLATGLKINGLTIAGEQLVPLENKQSIEFLKGLSSLESGVSSPGGLINFTTKRPANVGTVTLATDQRGSAFATLDFGRVFGSRKQFGVRTNIGGESIRSYVNDADGSRGFGTISADWQLDSATKIRSDFEYQHQVQRSVAGYQLLGGTTVPAGIHPSTMLGEQSWAKPNIFDAFNTSVRLDHSFGSNWTGYVTGGRSWSLVDDNVAYPYGCYYEDECNSGVAPYPWFFSPTGDYDVYDYRSPGELRIDDQFQAIVSGREKTGFIKHNIVFGTNLLRRSVALPAAVFDYVGTDNVYGPPRNFSPSSNSPGPASLQEDSHQYGIVVQDLISLPGQVTISVGGQIDTLHDHNFSNIDPLTGEQMLKVTDRTLWLPQYSIAFHPLSSLTLYGSYGKSLSLGPQAPFWALNGSVFLDPYFTRQVEVGAKFQANRKLLVSTALFQMRAPYFYTKPTQNGLEFVSEGHELHRGAEISVQGTVTKWLRLISSTAAVSAISDGTGTPEFEHNQVINQPRMRSTFSADVVVPIVKGLAIMPGWSYTGPKSATRDDTVSVGSYNLFSAGLRYTPHGESAVTFRLYGDNITNRRYWKDTGASLGDTFLHFGAPTTVRLSTQFSF
jgi:iron complex outermembrane receptor protein